MVHAVVESHSIVFTDHRPRGRAAVGERRCQGERRWPAVQEPGQDAPVDAGCLGQLEGPAGPQPLRRREGRRAFDIPGLVSGVTRGGS